MKTFRLNDDTLIEVQRSGRVYGPGSDCDLNFGTSYLYFRVNGGQWEHSPIRSDHAFFGDLFLCESISDFRELFPMPVETQ